MTHLMNNAVWFGTESDMRWIPAPAANYTKTKARWRAVDLYLHGGAGVRQAPVSHKTLSLSWPVQAQESLAPLVKFLEGPGPFYYVDPLDAQSNAVPSYWAEPHLSLEHGPELFPGLTPVDVGDGAAASQGYPTRGLGYTIDKEVSSNLVIPVPEGYTLHLGVHGSGTAQVTAGNVKAPLLSNTSPTRTNIAIAGPLMVRVGLAAPNSPNNTYPRTASIHGIIAQILPTGRVPQHGGFLPGLGHSQLALSNDPTITSYSANLPNAQTGIAADFVEVGAWI